MCFDSYLNLIGPAEPQLLSWVRGDLYNHLAILSLTYTSDRNRLSHMLLVVAEVIIHVFLMPQIL